MTEKKYLVSEDEFSGKVVIICDSYEEEVDVYQPTTEELLANQYLYRELPTQMELKTFYRVRAYYHYEETGEYGNRCIFYQVARTKEEANELFKQAIILTK